MSIDKKELRQAYKELQPPMGCFGLGFAEDEILYVGWTKNLEAAKNSIQFRLSVGAMVNAPDLQQQYNERNGEGFTFFILEELAYSEEHRDGYEDDLQALVALYREKFPSAKEIQVWKYPQH